MSGKQRLNSVEWPTLSLIIGCYLAWAAGTTIISEYSLTAGFVLVTLSVTLHSSLQHEVLHGHPFRSRWLSEMLVFPAPGLMIPYQRFRDTHLKHHQDERLTDPYDDPESNFVTPAQWESYSIWKQAVLSFNNTLIGRLLIGALISQYAFMRCDWGAIRRGDWQVLQGWLLHILGSALILYWVISVGQMPVWLYVLCAYCGTSILKIRTFLEHKAHEQAAGRTVVVEDRGLLSFLFLNNNYHSVHHAHPGVPWYALPDLFRRNREAFMVRNEGYYFESYKSVFRHFMFRRKDPVAHPIWPMK